MTTAAWPTWAPAKGGNEQGGTRIFGPSGKYSSRDLAAHTYLNPRPPPRARRRPPPPHASVSTYGIGTSEEDAFTRCSGTSSRRGWLQIGASFDRGFALRYLDKVNERAYDMFELMCKTQELSRIGVSWRFELNRAGQKLVIP